MSARKRLATKVPSFVDEVDRLVEFDDAGSDPQRQRNSGKQKPDWRSPVLIDVVDSLVEFVDQPAKLLTNSNRKGADLIDTVDNVAEFRDVPADFNGRSHC